MLEMRKRAATGGAAGLAALGQHPLCLAAAQPPQQSCSLPPPPVSAMAAARPSRLPSGGSVPPSPLMSPHQTPRPEQPNFFRPRYYTKEQTEQEAPSVKAGMSLKKMANQRKQYVKLIVDVCRTSKLGQFIACSAITFCHHFYLARTMQQNDPMLVAMAAVFLASKSENHGKAQLHQIIGWFFKIKYAKDKETGAKMFAMLSNPQQCEWLRDIVLKAERALLYVLGFRFQVDQPTAKLLQFATKYKLDSFYKVTTPGGPKLSQLAANFLNDMWETTLCLRHPANFLAAGALYCAIKITKTDVPLQEGAKPWYELAAGVTQQQLEVFDAELMQLYQQVPVDAKSGKKAASKAAAGPKPSADSSRAGQANGEARQHVPPAPGTPVSAGYAPAHRAAAREHTPDDTRSNGSHEQSAAKRSRPEGDGAAAEPAAKQARTGDNGADAAPLPPRSQPASSIGIPNGNAPSANGLPAAQSAARAAPTENGIASAKQQKGLQPGIGQPPAASADPVRGAAGSTAQPQPPGAPAARIAAPGLAAASAPATALPGIQTTPAGTA